MKTVLMIAPYFPPRRRVGSLRPFKFAVCLKNEGWQPVVLTIADHSSRLTEKEQKLLEGVRVIEIKPPFDRTPNPSKKRNQQPKRNPSMSNRFADWIDKQIPADSWIILFWLKYLWILNKAKKLNPDVIWSTGDPWSSHWLAEKLRSDLNKPWVADFRDPWIPGDVNLRKRSPFSIQIDKKIEEKVIEKADKLVFTSRATESNYNRHYLRAAGKTATIRNVSNKILYEGHGEKWEGKTDPAKLNLFFFGHFRALSPVGPVLAVLEHLAGSEPSVLDFLHIHSFGEPGNGQRKEIAISGFETCFVFHSPVVPEKTSTVLSMADLFLISTDPDRKDIIPAKLWDYLDAGKPILSIAPNPEIADILEETKAGVQFGPDRIHKSAMLLKECIEAKKSDEPLPIAQNRDGNTGHRPGAAQAAQQLASIFDGLTLHN